jgi:hypothetical protein
MTSAREEPLTLTSGGGEPLALQGSRRVEPFKSFRSVGTEPGSISGGSARKVFSGITIRSS